MRRFSRYLALMLLLSFNPCFGQGTLTFRFADPRIIRIAGYDHFEFDVQVKASASGTYLWSGQTVLHFGNTTFSESASQWSIVRGPLLTGTNTVDNYKYSLIRTITGVSPGKILNIGWTGDINVAQNSPNPDDFNEVPTVFTTLVTVRGRILLPGGTAGIDFVESSMNGQQFYCTAEYPFYAMYTSPSVFHPKDLLDTYAERIYSGNRGWSQTGNSVNAQWVNWNVAANTSIWDTTVAAGNITATGALASGLRIHSGGRLKIQPGAQLTCTGATEIGEPSGLWISSDSSASGSFIDNGVISYQNGGSARIEKYTGFGKWQSYCLPVVSTTTAPYSQVNLKYWTESDQNFHFVVDPAPPDSVLTGTPFRGYMTRSNLSGSITRISPVGSLITGNVASIPLTRTNPSATTIYNGFSYIGNPYSSAIDLASGTISWVNIENKAWVWNSANGGNYEVYLPAGGGTHSQYIPPQMAFYVRHSEANTIPAQVSLSNGSRTHITSNVYNSGTNSDLLYLKAQSVASSTSDLVSVCFREAATPGYDVNYDADKLWGEAGAPQLYTTISGRNLTIQSLPWTGGDQVVPLSFSCSISGNYTILASNLSSFAAGTIVSIEDMKLNITQSLITNPIYQFSYTSGEPSARFKLHFSNPSYPAVQASNVVVSSAIAPAMTFNWTDGNGTKRLVFMKQDTIGVPLPSGTVNYSASATYGSGTQIGSTGWFCVFNGTTHSAGLTVNNLILGNKYRIMVLEYNENGGNRFINTATAASNPKNQLICQTINPVITGPTACCQSAAGYTYSTATGMNSYVWTVVNGTISGGQGTHAITVKWTLAGTGSVKVSYRTSEGCQSQMTTKNVTITGDPAAAGVINGLSNVCTGATGVSYCVPIITNATSYVWSLPAGVTLLSGANTRCITVSFSSTPGLRTISVYGTNTCNPGASSSINISVNAKLTGTLTLKNMSVITGRDLCFSADTIITAGGGTTFVVQNGGNATLIAGSRIKMLAGTKTNPGGKMSASIATTCIPCLNSKSQFNNSLTEIDPESNPQKMFDGNYFVKLYPNPTPGDFTLEFINAGEVCTKAEVRIRTLLGKELARIDLEGKDKQVLSLSGYPSGVYLVTVMCGEHLSTLKIIRQ